MPGLKTECAILNTIENTLTNHINLTDMSEAKHDQIAYIITQIEHSRKLLQGVEKWT